MPSAVRVAPAAPMDPTTPKPDGAGVVNAINPSLQTRASKPPQADGSQGSAPSNEAQDRGWTQRQEAASKQDNGPPKEPLYQMLLNHVHSLWNASGRVVEIWLESNPSQGQVVSPAGQQTVANRNADPMSTPGNLAKEVLTYSPSKIKKPSKPE